jgi:transcription antitermination factor NusG
MLNLENSYHWYPIYTKSRSEKKISELFALKKINHYLPLKKTLKQWSDRKKWIEEPLIPSYIFVNISQKEYLSVLETKGVVRFIYFSGKIAPISDVQINNLKTYLSTDFEPEVTFRNLAKGQKVEIIEGKLKGFEGELISYQNENRLILRFEALGQTVLLKIPAGYVRPI